MPFAAKIALFWVGVGLLTALLRRRPDSRAARVLLSTQGPV